MRRCAAALEDAARHCTYIHGGPPVCLFCVRTRPPPRWCFPSVTPVQCKMLLLPCSSPAQCRPERSLPAPTPPVGFCTRRSFALCALTFQNGASSARFVRGCTVAFKFFRGTLLTLVGSDVSGFSLLLFCRFVWWTQRFEMFAVDSVPFA